MSSDVFIGTAGWAIPASHRAEHREGTHLTRYAAALKAVEINSSFYRPHRAATYARWAASVPPDFAFAVKVPRTMTHERRLQNCADLMSRFAEEVAGLGPKLGALLVQLPPSLQFQEGVARDFFALVGEQVEEASIVCEPRHPSWFTPAGDAALEDCRVARVAADPVLAPGADEPGGWRGLGYFRWHGAPRTYYSDYGPEDLDRLAGKVRQATTGDAPAWCIFDNTALGHAFSNALALEASLRRAPE